ncbi:M10 family metallopeptidase [Yersinia proxima]|uniref:M10 family metallopeptidase n=1 Tax=Yersinia proxima TaxID=2890316 RepID=UPI001D10899A|nr:M10 family metallopeptidase [Yersinia proxima]
MEEIKNTTNNLGNIDYAKIIYPGRWEIKDSNNITTVTFSFTQNIPKEYHHYKLNSEIPISSVNPSQISQVKTTLKNISAVANIRFVEDERTQANIPIVNIHPDKPIKVAGYAYIPGTRNLSPVCINADISENRTPTHLNYGGHVIAHELLHAVGLKHTHDTVRLTQRESVMSYLSEQYSGANYGGHHVSTPQLYDIAALQYLYGANMNTRVGNDSYTYSNRTPILCIWDAGGIDTFNFSDQTQDLVINLVAGSFSNVGGLTGNISIAYGATIENAVGGRGDDQIIGNDVDNILTGGYGADQFWGKNGSNIFCYRSTRESMTIAADTLHDFKSHKDKIDLSPLIYTNDNVALVDRYSFSGQTEIMQKYDEIRDITYLMIDFDNKVHETDMMIKLTGKHQLSLNNFIVSPQFAA